MVRRPIVAEVVDQQEGIELGRVAEAERPAAPDARAFHRRFRLCDAADGSD